MTTIWSETPATDFGSDGIFNHGQLLAKLTPKIQGARARFVLSSTYCGVSSAWAARAIPLILINERPPGRLGRTALLPGAAVVDLGRPGS
jgi:hypothetical protein